MEEAILKLQHEAALIKQSNLVYIGYVNVWNVSVFVWLTSRSRVPERGDQHDRISPEHGVA